MRITKLYVLSSDIKKMGDSSHVLMGLYLLVSLFSGGETLGKRPPLGITHSRHFSKRGVRVRDLHEGHKQAPVCVVAADPNEIARSFQLTSAGNRLSQQAGK